MYNMRFCKVILQILFIGPKSDFCLLENQMSRFHEQQRQKIFQDTLRGIVLFDPEFNAILAMSLRGRSMLQLWMVDVWCHWGDQGCWWGDVTAWEDLLMRLELEPDDRPDKNGWNLTTSEYKSSQRVGNPNFRLLFVTKKFNVSGLEYYLTALVRHA